ncbi:MAG TPA: glycosyltransferase family 39 protein [Candidatus Binataceae bacterium]|nr:glycosyltransferase family 39 protein [Candidatus Binataceae bacterium]
MLAWIAAPARAIPLLAAFGVVLFIVNLGGYPLYTKGEPREAVTIFDIVHGGGVILPMRAGVEIPSKPLLMHWLAALVSLGAGRVDEWTVRMPSAIFAILGLLVCYAYVRKLFDQRCGLVAALILGTTFQYLQAGTGARVDMTLTFFLELAFFEFIAIAEDLSERTTLFYLAISCAVLTKGPIGVALPAIVAVIWMALFRRWDLLRRLRLGRGAIIVGLIGGGWYIAAIAAGGSAFAHKQLLAENLYRLFAHHGFHEGHRHPFYYMELALAAGFLPWTPVAGLAAIQYWRMPRKIEARFGYLLVWFAAVLIFYNFPQSKRGVYLLALYPALSAIIAVVMVDAIDSVPSQIVGWTRTLSRAAGVFFVATAIAAAAGLAMLYRSPASFFWVLARFDILAAEFPPCLRACLNAHPIATATIPLIIAALGIWMLASRASIPRMTAGIAAGMMSLTLAANLVVEPSIANTLSLKQFARRTESVASGQAVGYVGGIDYAFAFYSGRNLKLVSPRDPEPPALIVSPEEQWSLMPPNFRAHYATILRSNPTDLDGTGRMLLLKRSEAPLPASRKPPLPDFPGLSI